MKNKLRLLSFAFFGVFYVAIFSLNIAAARTLSKPTLMKDTISVPDIQCNMCKKRIEYRLLKTEGITEAIVDVENTKVIVTYNHSKLSKSKIESVIANIGYTAGGTKADILAQGKLPMCCKPSPN